MIISIELTWMRYIMNKPTCRLLFSQLHTVKLKPYREEEPSTGSMSGKVKVCANKGRSFIRQHTLYLKSRGKLRLQPKRHQLGHQLHVKPTCWSARKHATHLSKLKRVEIRACKEVLKKVKKETFLQLTLWLMCSCVTKCNAKCTISIHLNTGIQFTELL